MHCLAFLDWRRWRATPPTREHAFMFRWHGGLALLIAVTLLGAFSAVASASPDGEAVAEERAEAAEVASEAAEAAADAAEGPRPLRNPRAYGRYLAKVEHLRAHIHALRARIKVIRTLPHSTTIYRVHRPKKHERIARYRKRIKELRAKAAEGV